MRKKVFLTFAIIIILFMPSITTMAASGINSEEQAIVDRIRAGYTVDGIQYYVGSQYINQGVNYLSRDDVNITAEQRASILAKLEEMAPQGVIQGYLKPVVADDHASEIIKDQDLAESVGSNLTNKETEVGNNTDSNAETDLVSSTQLKEKDDSISKATEKMSMSEIIESAKAITEDMNISVSYDLEANEIKVINSEGKAVLAANKTIKNTGFSLNTTVIIAGFILCSLVCSIVVAAKLHLFSFQEEEAMISSGEMLSGGRLIKTRGQQG